MTNPVSYVTIGQQVGVTLFVAWICIESVLHNTALLPGPWSSSHYSLHILHRARDVSHAACPHLCHDDIILQPNTSKALRQV